MDSQQLCALLGPIKSERLRLHNGNRSDHGPKYVIQRPTFPEFVAVMPIAHKAVKIVDFGEAFPFSQPRTTLGAPVDQGYFPPEICFGYPASSASDIWELACLVYQTLGTLALFPCFFPIFEFLVGTAMPILGPLPVHWKGRFDWDRYGYRENGELQNAEKKDIEWWWDDAMHDKSVRGQMERHLAAQFCPEQLDFLADLLSDMLVFEPEKRISAAEVVQRFDSASALFLQPASKTDGVHDGGDS